MVKCKPFPLILALQLAFVSDVFTQGLRSSQIDSLVNQTMKTMPLAGLAIAVVKDGKVVHAKGYGVTAAGKGEKVDENTLFAIASNSKAFTTMALAMLVDEGKLGWHDKVVDHIPEFRMYSPYVTANFNIQDLLTHRSGLGLGAGDLMFFPDGSDFKVDDVIRSFQYQTPVSAFRTKYDYDNLLYVVAGEVVARVSGMRWSEFVKTRIMEPLGMHRSAGVYQVLKDKKNVALPHTVVNGTLREIGTYTKNDESLGAAGGIYASVRELSQWMLLHLNRGTYGDHLSQRLVSGANHAEMWRPHTFIGFSTNPESRYKTHFSAYGLGWRIQDVCGYVEISHTGGLPGMLSKTTLIPELNVGIVVLTNTDPGGHGYRTLSQAIADAYLALPPRDWISAARQSIDARATRGDSVENTVWNTVKKATYQGPPLENLVGTYRDNWFGDVSISLRSGQLWFSSRRSPKLNGKMSYYKGNTFAIRWEYQDMPCDALATFTLDAEGQAVEISMKGISPNIDFSFDFQDLALMRVPFHK